MKNESIESALMLAIGCIILLNVSETTLLKVIWGFSGSLWIIVTIIRLIKEYF